ncbi:MAG: hypothetical protein R2848_04690 [Thermomicrobiales bacterium]
MSAPGFYDYYATVPRIFGIDLEMDQQLAGLMMWVGGTSICSDHLYLLLGRSGGAADREPRPGPPPGAPVGVEGA